MSKVFVVPKILGKAAYGSGCGPFLDEAACSIMVLHNWARENPTLKKRLLALDMIYERVKLIDDNDAAPTMKARRAVLIKFLRKHFPEGEVK